jgi:hypothetical protein
MQAEENASYRVNRQEFRSSRLGRAFPRSVVISAAAQSKISDLKASAGV